MLFSTSQFIKLKLINSKELHVPFIISLFSFIGLRNGIGIGNGNDDEDNEENGEDCDRKSIEGICNDSGTGYVDMSIGVFFSALVTFDSEVTGFIVGFLLGIVNEPSIDLNFKLYGLMLDSFSKPIFLRFQKLFDDRNFMGS